jgi:hypothetical protein
MGLNAFLNATDAGRAERTLQKLARHDLSGWALTGGLAIEMHILSLGGEPICRPLHDVDFIADGFEAIPVGIAAELMLRHVHPHDPPAKTMLQGVDPETAVRVDVFRGYGSVMERVVPAKVAGVAFPMVSFRDLVARHARLTWDLVEGRPVAPKYTRDFLRMVNLVSTAEIQSIWLEHRKPQSPPDFEQAVSRLREEIEMRSDLLVAPAYSTNVEEICRRCEHAPGFPLADAGKILAILGYC